MDLGIRWNTMNAPGYGASAAESCWSVKWNFRGLEEWDGEEASCSQLRALNDLEAVRVRIESAVPLGCQVTVELNGEVTTMRPALGRHKKPSVEEKRWTLAPLQAPSTDEAIGDEADEAASSSAAPRDRSSARFLATVTLDTGEVQAKTSQHLKEPELEVEEVFDTAVLVRLSSLTGDRFELTVYASGASESLGEAATLVQRGPVRSPESVHRIGELMSSQVYVVWVRVFSDNTSRESKQKGFKTLPPQVKSIWDEPDHIILGIERTASSKEVTKAWRQKSLQFHPDKETDPEKKDSAEEMMKRLNLAKQNMLRCASLDDGSPGGAARAPKSPASPDLGPGMPPPDMKAPEFNPQGSPVHPSSRRPTSCSSSASDDSSQEGASPGSAGPQPHRPSEATSRPAADSALEDDGTLGFSLCVESPKPPKLRVLTRGITHLVVEASGLPRGGMAEIQSCVDGVWKAVTPRTPVTSPVIKVTVSDLDENSMYRLRLRTIVTADPLHWALCEGMELVPVDEASRDAEEAEGAASASVSGSSVDDDDGDDGVMFSDM